MPPYQLSKLYIYPVKSLAGFSVDHWPVTKTGLKHDRKWMLVDSDGQFLSQRKIARMALIKTALTEDRLILSAPTMPDLSLPLGPVGGDLVACVIWKDRCHALGVAPKADHWLSRFLNQDCRLVYQPDDEIRRVDPLYADASDSVAYSDGFPFLIISENSLAALNREMRLELPMSRFRPNLVISGCPGYAEDEWREISIGAIDFRLPKPCSRCAVPTINPETAESGKEPLVALNRTRKWQNKVYFGQNALHNQSGVLSVGDVVEVKLTGPKRPPI